MSSETDGVLVNHDLLRETFPQNCDYKLKYFKISNQSEGTLVFESEMRVNVKTEHLSVSWSVNPSVSQSITLFHRRRNQCTVDLVAFG